MGNSQKSAEAEHKRKQKELAAAQARDNELDGLFERIYEDNLAGKLSDERFAKMSQRYEAEQAELAEKMKLLHHEIDKLSSNLFCLGFFTIVAVISANTSFLFCGFFCNSAFVPAMAQGSHFFLCKDRFITDRAVGTMFDAKVTDDVKYFIILLWWEIKIVSQLCKSRY